MGSIWSRLIFLKIYGINSILVNLVKRSTRVIWSRSIFLKDRQEPFDHGWSFLKIEKIKRSLVILRDIITSILVFKIMLSFCKIMFSCKKIVPMKVIILMSDGDTYSIVHNICISMSYTPYVIVQKREKINRCFILLFYNARRVGSIFKVKAGSEVCKMYVTVTICNCYTM